MLVENKKALDEIYNDVNLSSDQSEQLLKFVELLETWNDRINLVSQKDVSRIVSRHVRDSLAFCDSLLLYGTESIMDMGSGGGFPGIPLKIIMPQLQITLLDSKRLKTIFLKDVVGMLGLEGVEVVRERAENLEPKIYYHRYDAVVSRAVASLKKLWLWSEPLLKPFGKMTAQKGGDLTSEMAEMKLSFPDIAVKEIDMGHDMDTAELKRKFIVVSHK